MLLSGNPLEARALRAVATGVALVLLAASRLTSGEMRETPDGTAFPIKPMFAWSRAVALPAYFLFFAYVLYAQHVDLPGWVYLLFWMAVGLGLCTLPATIVLGPEAVTQTFWLRGTKRIPYEAIVAIQRAGLRRTRIRGGDGAKIVHTLNHSATEEFRREIERRTGMPLG